MGQQTLFENPDCQKIIDIANASDRIAIAFSGGRDSSLAAFWAIKKYKEKCVLVFVDTGAELQDVVEYVFETSRHYGVPVHMVRNISFFEKYGPSQAFPAPQHMSCVTDLIYGQIDAYNVSVGDSFCLVTGAQKKQKQRTSSTVAVMEKKHRGVTFKIINPLYSFDEDEIRRDFLMEWHLWNGYKLGFDRTACWCCPFQRPQQYDMLRKYYPILFDRLMHMAEVWQTHDCDLERYYIKRFGMFAKKESPVLGEECPAQDTVEICHTAPNTASTKAG